MTSMEVTSVDVLAETQGFGEVTQGVG
jgi:hypothetical protein